MDLSRYRDEFPVTKGAAFLDNAAVAPISKRVRRRMDEWADDALAVARPSVDKWFANVERTRSLAAQLLGCHAGEVAFAGSTGGGLSLVAQSIDWRTMDSVVIGSNEFPANAYPWLNLKRLGVRVKMVKPTKEGRILIDDVLAAIDRRTRAVAISWVGFNTGFRIDLARLGGECAKRGVYLVVDAIQGLGAFAMRVKEWNVTAAAADAHKWLLGPEGTALVYVSRDVIESLHPPVAGWKSVKNSKNFMRYDFVPASDATRFEPGSYNMCGIAGLGGALELFLEAGMGNVTARVKELTDFLVKRLGDRGVAVRSPRGEGEWSGIVSFPAPGGDGPGAQKALQKRGVVCTGRADFMRVSPHFYNNEADVDTLLGALYRE